MRGVYCIVKHFVIIPYSQDMTEDEGFLIRIGDESTQLRAKLDKRTDTINETHSFGPFHEVATVGQDCFLETQERDRRRLDLIAQLLLLTREGIEEKQAHVERLKDVAESDDD